MLAPLGLVVIVLLVGEWVLGSPQVIINEYANDCMLCKGDLRNLHWLPSNLELGIRCLTG